MTSTLFALDEHISPVRPPREKGYAAVYTLRRGLNDTPRTLTEARTSMGLTMTDVARLLHVSRPTVSGWEKGLRRPARYRWGGLAAVLKLTEAQVGTLFADHPPARLDGVPLPSLASERRRRGFTQQKVAELVRVAPTTLSMWETAEIPVSPAMAALLAEVLDTDEAALLAAPIPDLGPDPRPLRRLRREAWMRQREAAAQLGIAVGSLARYEAGERRVPVDVIRRMAAAYRRTTAEVLAASGVQLLPLPTGARWLPEQVPEGLRAARTAAGLTKVELGRAVGRSGQAVLGWERGRSRPASGTCRSLEAVLGLSVGKLPW